ncbi:MAG TPA: hypothetical protein VHO04_12195 [Sphingopyxis sp.]|jgi:hypothetical protein|uniref:hypothetical protein n=1 Tax=Sphingopyxis sp. TaxID=1908224 RepID=UPI002E36484E|nr:hypothetical protein [Sphingopyxis sp.]HEX2813433.1 hypothetical protein [Sphingopyxis sp.]
MISALFAAPPLLAKENQQIVVAKRFATSLLAGQPVEISDFVSPPNANDFAALSVVSECRLLNVGYPAVQDPKRPNIFVEVRDHVSVRLDCPHTPGDTPAGLSLLFENDKIKSIETHNLDLIGRD